MSAAQKSKYANIFKQVGDAKEHNNWLPALPEGTHRVALLKYGPKESGKDKSIFLECDLMILETNNPAATPGSKHSVAWFVNKPDEFGYTMGRAKTFLRILQESTGDESSVEEFGESLAEDFFGESPSYYGAIMDVDVVQVTNKDGTARKGKKGGDLFNQNFIAVPPDLQDGEATAALIEELAGRAVASKAAPAKPAASKAAPATVAAEAEVEEAPAAPAAPVRKLGGLKGLVKGK